jgi:hypothetical protein
VPLGVGHPHRALGVEAETLRPGPGRQTHEIAAFSGDRQL